MNPDVVKAVVDRAPELTDGQRARIRVILLPALPTAQILAPTEHDDGPDVSRGRRSRSAAAKTKEGRPHATP